VAVNSVFSKSLQICFALLTLTTFSPAFSADRPNILIIWGDDIGTFNISAYNDGIPGLQDRDVTITQATDLLAK